MLRLNEKPYLVGSVGMLWGWLSSALNGLPRYDDKEFRAFLRRYHWLVLTRGKTKALEIIHAERVNQAD